MRLFFNYPQALAAIILLTSALTASAFEYDGFKYDIIDQAERTCALVYNSNTPYTGDVTVPATTIYNSGTPWEEEYTVTRIDNEAFASCAALTSVTLPSTITAIGEKAFYSCPDLKSVSLPESITSIGSYAFAESKVLESVTLPSKIVTIDEGMFKGCSSLKSMTIPANVTWICKNSLASVRNVTLDRSETKLSVPDKYPSDENLYPPRPFSPSLKKITTGRNFDTGYHDDVFFQGSLIFSGNTYGFDNVTELEVTDNALMDDFFDVCSFRNTIISLSIGENISGFPTSLSKYTSLKRLMLADMTPPPCPEFSDMQRTWTTLYVPQGAIEAYRGATGWMDFRIIVGYDAGFTLPEPKEYDFETGGIGYRITDLGECSVTYTDKEKMAAEVEIPSTVMYDGRELEVSSIGQEAFRDCANMTSLTIPGTLSYLGYQAFMDCKGLRKVTFVKSDRKLDFGYEMPMLGACRYATFNGCDAVDILVIGREISINLYDDRGTLANLGLTTVNDVIIPDGAKVGNIVEGLTTTKSITLGKDMTDFPTDMSDCRQLESLILRDETPRPCPYFMEEQYSAIKLYVPDGALEAYRNADGWKKFLSVSALDDSTIAIPACTETGRYDLQGREVTDAYKGIVIIRYSDGTAAKTLAR